MLPKKTISLLHGLVESKWNNPPINFDRKYSKLKPKSGRFDQNLVERVTQTESCQTLTHHHMQKCAFYTFSNFHDFQCALCTLKLGNKN
jgi:hypothetical protein